MKLGKDSNALKWQMLHGFVMRRLLLGAFAFGSVLLVISIIHMSHNMGEMEPVLEKFDECPLNFHFNNENATEVRNPFPFFRVPVFGGFKMPYQESKDLAKTIFRELMDKNLLNSSANVLCVGEGSIPATLAMKELGFSHSYRVDYSPAFSILSMKFVSELDFSDAYFDFVYSRAVDKVPMPALLVLEIERVLRPGGIGAVLVGTWDLFSGNLIRSTSAVSSFLKSSDVIYVCGVGSFALVIFQRRSQEVISFEQYQLPKNCPSIAQNKPFMEFIEPLIDRESRDFQRDISYLPKFMDISSRNKLIDVNVGVEEFTDMSTTNLVQPYYSIHSKDFNIFLIDHNASVLSSHVKNHGIVFIYHPGLAENNAAQELDSDELMDDEDFDFIEWFKETRRDNYFVVLRINARRVKYDILHDLFKTGAICYVDELFLHCPGARNCRGSSCADCLSLFKSLRDSGVFVHQWMGD